MPLENVNNSLVSDTVDASISPPQAFVNIATQTLLSGVDEPAYLLLYSNVGLTKFEENALFSLALMLHSYFSISGPTGIPVNFSGNNLSDVDPIFDTIRSFVADHPTAGGTLNISGGTNAVPDPAQVTALTGAGAGWVVIHN